MFLKNHILVRYSYYFWSTKKKLYLFNFYCLSIICYNFNNLLFSSYLLKFLNKKQKWMEIANKIIIRFDKRYTVKHDERKKKFYVIFRLSEIVGFRERAVDNNLITIGSRYFINVNASIALKIDFIIQNECVVQL